MRAGEILCCVCVSVIVLNLSVCHSLPVVVNQRPGNIYHVFRGPMPGVARSPVVRTKINSTCVEKCGDKYYMCSVETCPDEDAVCNQYCTGVFRYCFKTCSLESPTPSPLQILPVMRNDTSNDTKVNTGTDSLSPTMGSWIFDEKLYKEAMKRNNSNPVNVSHGNLYNKAGLNISAIRIPTRMHSLPQMQFARIAR